ncbi:MAG: cadherin domain-containing protein [Pseudomonadota bacterium]
MRTAFLITPFSLMLLSGCGGNSSSPQTTTNAAPVFTSAATAETAENVTGTVYTATATDSNNDTLTFSISGGSDQGAFQIDPASGALTFLTAPDFEAPADADLNNAYDVQISASDGNGGTVTLAVTITVTDLNENAAGVAFRDKVFNAIEVTRGIQFGEGLLADGSTQPLLMDVFTGSGDTRRDRPVLIVGFGGGFIAGSRDSVESLAHDWALRGYVTATIDYRLITTPITTVDEAQVGVVRALHDMYAAVRFFREDAQGANQYGVRGDAIIVSGFSAGAILAATAATTDTNEVGLFSPAVQDFLTTNGGLFGNSSANTSVSSEVQGAVVISGAISALDAVDSNDPPYYAAHEEFDPVVPCTTMMAEASETVQVLLSGSCDITARYASLGRPNQLFLVAGSIGHIEFTEAEELQIFDESAAFIYTQVIEPLLATTATASGP